MKLKYRTFKVSNPNYQRLLQIKKDFGLKDGDEVIDWMFNNLRLETAIEPDGDDLETEQHPGAVEHSESSLPLLNEVSVEEEIDKVLGEQNG